MVRSLPVSVWIRASSGRTRPNVFDLRSDMVELIHGHSVDVLTRLVEVSRCASR